MFYNHEMINADDVFDPKDFESVKLIISFANFTTGTEIKDPKQISLIEIGEKLLVFEVPHRSCNEKHNVTISIHQADKSTKKGKTELLNVTGKIISVEDVGEQRARIVVDCVQFDEQSWQNLVNLYLNRQNDIEAFFKAVKGY